MIGEKYQQAREDGLLTFADENMPLVILNPDRNGHTALDIALKRQRPRSFEVMINMLEHFDHFCLSKMMLTCLPEMISDGTDLVN